MPKLAAVKKKAESQPLPTMEDMGLPEVQSAAASLLDIRTRRIALTKEESDAEQTLIKVMQKQEPPRDFYSHDGLEVTIAKGKDKAKVKFEGNGDPDTE